MALKLLDKKVCIVTGAARGIGRAIAECFAGDGALVYANDMHGDELKDWPEEYAEKYSTRVVPLCFDITDSLASKNALLSVFKAEGRIDCLVNNAAVISNKKLGMMLRDEMEQMFRVNVIAVIEMIQTVSRLMARGGGGSIVNIGSVTAVYGSSGQAVYSSTKGALISLTKSAAKELAHLNIRVNAVAPGIVKTERFDELYAAEGDKINERISRIALGRLGTPLDVAHACSFLASDRAAYISGQVIGVDGCSIM